MWLIQYSDEQNIVLPLRFLNEKYCFIAGLICNRLKKSCSCDRSRGDKMSCMVYSPCRCDFFPIRGEDVFYKYYIENGQFNLSFYYIYLIFLIFQCAVGDVMEDFRMYARYLNRNNVRIVGIYNNACDKIYNDNENGKLQKLSMVCPQTYLDNKDAQLGA